MRRELDVVVVGSKHLLNRPDAALAIARDKATVQHTAFSTFAELVNAKGSYRPSVYMRCGRGRKTHKAMRELLFLTIQYNNHQQARGDSRRALQLTF